jgi:NADPH-dependent 2,4-dienoyl-CoA reductase/sulfur reductase-like enzyme
VLKSGKVLDADLVVEGLGGRPNTWFLKDIALEKDGGVTTDVFLRTSNKDIFASGDIANYPYFYKAERIRVEHISEAMGHGTYAAWNMMGKMIPYDGVPFFWTRQFNKGCGFVGHAGDYDQVIIDGSLKDYNFAAFYLKNKQVVAASGIMRGGDLITVNHAMRLNIRIGLEDFQGTKLDLDKLKQKISEKRPPCPCSRYSNINAQSKI